MRIEGSRLLREAAAFMFTLTGLPLLVRTLIATGRVGILLYHDPDPELFGRHLDYLSRHYSLIPFETLVAALENGRWTAVPRRSVVIHIDDGYAGNYRLRDQLMRHGIKPTLYLCSDIVGSRRRFWSRLDNGRSKRIRLLDNPALLKKLRDEAGFTPDREYPERQALSVDELAEMSGTIDIQSHGRCHFSLLTLDDRALIEELSASRASVERITGKPCEHFSFPYGDYGDRELEAVRLCGYRTARTTEPGWNGRGTDRYRLRIVADVPGDCSVNRLRAHLTGLPRFVKWIGYRLVTRHLHAMRQAVLVKRRVFRPSSAS